MIIVRNVMCSAVRVKYAVKAIIFASLFILIRGFINSRDYQMKISDIFIHCISVLFFPAKLRSFMCPTLHVKYDIKTLIFANFPFFFINLRVHKFATSSNEEFRYNDMFLFYVFLSKLTHAQSHVPNIRDK